MMKTLRSLGSILMVLVVGISLVSCSEDYHSRLPELIIKDMTFGPGTDPLFSETQDQVFRNEDLSNYTITADANWCFPSIDIASCKIQVRVYGNDTYGERSAEVTITDIRDNTVRSFKVTQTQNNAILVDKDTYSVVMAGGEVPIKVSYNVDYTVDISEPDWIHLKEGSSTRGLTEKTLVFVVDVNNSGDEREGVVKIINSDKSVYAQATIKQSFSPELEVDQTSFVIDELAQKVEMKYNTNFEVYLDFDYPVSWITEGALQKVDANNFIRTLEVDAFKQKEASRSIKITLYNDKYEKSIWKDVTVTQQRTLYIPEIEDTESGKIEMYVGDSVKVNYVNTKERKVTWTSSDNDVVTVNEEGQVKAVALGEETITLKSADGKYSDTVTVLVKEPEDITNSLSCEWSEDIAYGDDGETITGYTISNSFMNDSKFELIVSECRFYNNGVLVKKKEYNSRTGKLSSGGAIEMPQSTVVTRKDYYVEWDYTYCNEKYTLKYTQAGEKTIKKEEASGTTEAPVTPAASYRKVVRRR